MKRKRIEDWRPYCEADTIPVPEVYEETYRPERRRARVQEDDEDMDDEYLSFICSLFEP